LADFLGEVLNVGSLAKLTRYHLGLLLPERGRIFLDMDKDDHVGVSDQSRDVVLSPMLQRHADELLSFRLVRFILIIEGIVVVDKYLAFVKILAVDLILILHVA